LTIRFSRSSRDDLGQGSLAEHPAQRRVQERRELDIGGLDRTDALVKPQRVLDAVAGERIDHQAPAVESDDFLRWIFEVEDTLVDRDHRIDEGRLEIQARIGDDADRLAQPHQQHLFGLRHGEHRAVANDKDNEQQQQ